MRLPLMIFALVLGTTDATASYRRNVEGWEVFNFVTKERNGNEIVGCMGTRLYREGTRLSFVVTTAYDWAIGVANEGWQLKQGAVTEFAAYVD